MLHLLKEPFSVDCYYYIYGSYYYIYEHDHKRDIRRQRSGERTKNWWLVDQMLSILHCNLFFHIFYPCKHVIIWIHTSLTYVLSIVYLGYCQLLLLSIVLQ